MSDPISELIRFEFDLTGSDQWLDDVSKEIRQLMADAVCEAVAECDYMSSKHECSSDSAWYNAGVSDTKEVVLKVLEARDETNS